MLSGDDSLLALCDRAISCIQEEADPYSPFSLSEPPEDLLFVTHPINPLLSIHGECRGRDTAFGDGMLADGTERLLWSLAGSGPGEFGYSVVNYLLAGRCGPRASPRPCRVEAVLHSGQHPQLRSLGRNGDLLCSLWLEAQDRQAFPFDGSLIPLQPRDESISLRYTISIPSLYSPLSFLPQNPT